MSAPHAHPSPWLRELLACPSCHGPLTDSGPDLDCQACSLRYRVEDGVPVLLTDEAAPL